MTVEFNQKIYNIVNQEFVDFKLEVDKQQAELDKLRQLRNEAFTNLIDSVFAEVKEKTALAIDEIENPTASELVSIYFEILGSYKPEQYGFDDRFLHNSATLEVKEIGKQLGVFPEDIIMYLKATIDDTTNLKIVTEELFGQTYQHQVLDVPHLQMIKQQDAKAQQRFEEVAGYTSGK